MAMISVAIASLRARIRPIHLLILVLLAVIAAIVVTSVVRTVMQPRRTTAVYDPPVLAGQQLWGACAGGFYARHGDTIVLTSTGHCTKEASSRTTRTTRPSAASSARPHATPRARIPRRSAHRPT